MCVRACVRVSVCASVRVCRFFSELEVEVNVNGIVAPLNYMRFCKSLN